MNGQEQIGGPIMKEENEYKNQLNEMKSQLYQIKILLLMLIVLCIGGFYGVSRSMWDDVAAWVTRVFEVLIVICFFAALITLIVWIKALSSSSTTTHETDEKSPSKVD